ncbi:hypothetical protein LOTGIDRAFT_136681 [Lottia gigantea]|uniref:Peroxisome assembly protein 12 n=1 Tax=Lottia gigantea TaxID=225164 RepID=V4B9Q0_LOTGI|nr:hypothetical protein LOTGIDRAFT_136681 [Lottia gigantea]ESP04191.1 hypothetical protein LOTGIDRAFT_136681 [Lottia gigantea]
MAQHGAHLTSVEADRPTIFEVLAQESLSTTIRPAAKHAIKVLAENRPDRFGWMLQYFDEVYTVLDFIVQNHYLNKYGGSFAENFYDLRRIVSSTKSPFLPRNLKWKSLICLVILPYLKLKVDKLFEDIRHRSHYTIKDGITKAFLGVYPYINMIWEGTNLWYQLAYMFGKSNYHSWLLRYSGTELSRISEDDLWIPSPQTPVTSWADKSFQKKIISICSKLFKWTAVSLSTGVSVAVFFLQFLDWWYQREDKAVSLTSLPIPDPPQDGNEELSAPVCPICNQKRQNETALSVSGHVFCYRCIYSYINQHGSCPVSSYPATLDHLIKLYPPDT